MNNNKYIIRQIKDNDYEEYITLINSPISKKDFLNFIHYVLNKHHLIYVLIINNDGDNEHIIGTGTLLIEPKMTYGICFTSHIENILINDEYRGQHYGSKLVKFLLNVSKKLNCYRTDLICTKELEYFYEKNDFKTNKLSNMTIYFPSNFK